MAEFASIVDCKSFLGGLLVHRLRSRQHFCKLAIVKYLLGETRPTGTTSGFGMLARVPSIDVGYNDPSKKQITIVWAFPTPVEVRAAADTGHVDFGATAVGHTAVSLVQSGFDGPVPRIGVMMQDLCPARHLWQRLASGGEGQISTTKLVTRLLALTNRAFIFSAWYTGTQPVPH